MTDGSGPVPDRPGHAVNDPANIDEPPAPKYDPQTGKLLDRPSRKPLYILIAVLFAIAMLAYFLIGGGDDKHEMKGLMQLFSAGNVDGDIEHCKGTGGYDDIDEGADVTIKDQDGKIVGTGRLRNGTKDEVLERLVASGEKEEGLTDILDDSDGIVCVLLFEADVADADIYSIQVGNDTRGAITMSTKDLEESDWIVEVTLSS